MGCRGVSPVIGVILMVAITVILAAIIGVFVMNMGPSESGPDNAQLEFEESTGWLAITHDGGEALTLSEYRVEVELSGSTPEAMMDTRYSGSEMTAGDQWNIKYIGAPPSAPTNHLGTVVEPSLIKEVRILWESPNSDQTQIFDTWSP